MSFFCPCILFFDLLTLLKFFNSSSSMLANVGASIVPNRNKVGHRDVHLFFHHLFWSAGPLVLYWSQVKANESSSSRLIASLVQQPRQRSFTSMLFPRSIRCHIILKGVLFINKKMIMCGAVHLVKQGKNRKSVK